MRTLARSTDRRLLLVAVAAAIGVPATFRWLPAEARGPLLDTVVLVLAVIAPFALDDDARHTLAVVPVPLRHRLALRVFFGLVSSAVLWVAASTLSDRLVPNLDAGALTEDWARAVLVALTSALVAHRWHPEIPPAAVGAFAVLTLQLVTVFPATDSLRASSLVDGWVGVAGLAVAATFAFRWASRDPLP